MPQANTPTEHHWGPSSHALAARTGGSTLPTTSLAMKAREFVPHTFPRLILLMCHEQTGLKFKIKLLKHLLQESKSAFRI